MQPVAQGAVSVYPQYGEITRDRRQEQAASCQCLEIVLHLGKSEQRENRCHDIEQISLSETGTNEIENAVGASVTDKFHAVTS